jgi:ubiquinone biosynthesis protein COQ4
VTHRPRDWRRALAALRRLLADKDDTAQVFEIMRSLSGAASQRSYRRLVSTIEGGRIAYERVELAERLMDRAWLAGLPAGSVGAAYAAFTAREQLSAEGLALESRRGLAEAEIDLRHPYAWYGRRLRDIHDIWHVLTGYGRDAVGELCLVAFSHPQNRSLGWALIAAGGYLRARGQAGRPYRRAVREAWRRGRAAAWLPAEDYEQLLAEPLDAARRRLGLTPALAYEALSPEARNPDLGKPAKAR